MEYKYRIYGRKGNGKFKPFDAEGGIFVTNLIYASMWPAEVYEQLKEDVVFMNENNPEFTFEIRNI